MARAHVELQLRWGDQDAYGHVNNVVYARLLEEARVRVLWLGEAIEDTGLETHFQSNAPGGPKMLVASQSIDYVSVLQYSARPVIVELWVGKLGGAHLELHCEILDGAAATRTVVARAITVAVMVDGETLRPVRLSSPARQAVAAWTDEPLVLGRH